MSQSDLFPRSPEQRSPRTGAVVRGVAVGAVTGLLAAGAAVLGGATTATAEEGGPAGSHSPLRLWAPDLVQLVKYDDFVDGQLGVRAIAQEEPFELWSTRPAYDQQIRTEWRSSAGTVVLPEGLMTDFTQLGRFLRLTIRDSEGSLVRRRVLGACLNSYASERVLPEAPARSPYPLECPWNPYTVGSVQGVQAGWASDLFGWGLPMRLPTGDFQATATVVSDWAEPLGIAWPDRKVTFRLRVVEGGGHRVRPRPPAAEVAEPRASEPAGDSGGVANGPIPDLRSLPPFAIGVSNNGDFLQFAATTWNAGNSPLVVDGFRSDTEEDVMDAYQYFFDADGNQTGYQRVGTMHWHAARSHNHWHFLDFARYTLLNADRTEVVRSRKESWCLANTDAVDFTVPGADWQPSNTDLGSSCGGQDALSVRQVLSSGSGDTYAQYRAGQSFDLRGLPNGKYFLKVDANPRDLLVESDYDNNVRLRKVWLGGEPGARTVRVPKIGIIDAGVGWRPHPAQIG